MKKVALIFSTDISNQTGAAAVIRSIHENSKSFNDHGVEIELYSPNQRSGSNTTKSTPSNHNKETLYKRTVALIKNAGKKSNIAAVVAILGSMFRPAKNIIKQFNSCNKDEDIVFFHELITCYYFLRTRNNIGKKRKIVLILHTNGDSFSMLRNYYPKIAKSIFYKYLLSIERKVLSELDVLGFVAEEPRENFLRLHPDFDPNKVKTIYNGIENNNREANRSTSGRAITEICCVGSVCERKGQRFIVEAIRHLKDDPIIENVHFTIVGGGDLVSELSELTSSYNMNKYISFVGPSNRIDDFLFESDIFILPSVDEGFPIAILEAMRAKLPIVATRVGGIPEMVEGGVSGLLIDASVDGVISFLSELDKFDWKKMGENSYNLFVEKFTDEKMVSTYSKIINSL